MSTTIDIHEAQANLPRLLVRVSAGEEIVIANAGKPVAHLVATEEETTQHLPGRAKGQVVFDPDFDAPLPEDLLDAFET